jgi:hypothetical protein
MFEGCQCTKGNVCVRRSGKVTEAKVMFDTKA